MRQKPEILRQETVAQSRIFRIERLSLRFANGVETEYERVRSVSSASKPPSHANKNGRTGGAVLIVPVSGPNEVLMIREYAAGTDRYELGFAKGKIDGDESIEAAANRELMEEVGYGARKLTHLTSLSVAPGYLASITHIVLAEDLYPQRLEGDEPEEIEVVPWALDQISALLARDDFSEARSLAALYLARDHLQNHEN